MIFVVGVGRSGTTLLGRALEETGHRMIFEPFGTAGSRIAQPAFEERVVVTEDNAPVVREFMRKISTFQLDCPWFHRGRSRGDGEPLIKSIRIMPSIGWFMKEYDAKFVFIGRCPLCTNMSVHAVSGGGLNYSPKMYAGHVNGFSKEAIALASSTESKTEKILLDWFFSNTLLLEAADGHNAIFLWYSDLCEKPILTCQRIRDKLGINVDEMMSYLGNNAKKKTRPHTEEDKAILRRVMGLFDNKELLEKAACCL